MSARHLCKRTCTAGLTTASCVVWFLQMLQVVVGGIARGSLAAVAVPAERRAADAQVVGR